MPSNVLDGNVKSRNIGQVIMSKCANGLFLYIPHREIMYLLSGMSKVLNELSALLASDQLRV